jgi:SAM-dependent methyltransferase
MGLWSRVFAVAYDPFLARAERAGLATARRDLLADVRGRVLEIGAGTGLNVEHYPAGSDVLYTEPDPHMARRLRARGVEVVAAGAEALPFPDATFDTVVSTLVLCTVPDVPAALREIKRVLMPAGRLLFLEHVRAAPGTKLERWQDRLHGPWHALACGCNCNRDLLRELSAASFSVVGATREEWRFMPPIVRPVLRGSAAPAAS